MTSYLINNFNPQTKFCSVSSIFETDGQSLLELSIPCWRPGRYSLQNYAELIQDVKFSDENDLPLVYTKLNLDTWIIQTKNIKRVRVKYNFYANKYEAGDSFIGDDFILLNPINSLMYDKNNLNQECRLIILSQDMDCFGAFSFESKNESLLDLGNEIFHFAQVDSGYENQIACASTFQDFHMIADTPLLLVKKDSHKFKKLNFEVEDLEGGKINIELAIYGVNKLDPVKIEADFSTFISEQVKIFKTFAVKNYTFLCILPDFPFYHGVEHQHSSVNIFGSGFDVHKESDYKQFLGLCCHEFFHHWNIKSIRPIELNTYNYSKEQLFTTGYVAEGFTTYYGDLILYRSKLITLEDYAQILSKTATFHIQNFGKFKSTMSESSLDLWLDGYKAGIPDDKVNIYIEGCLLTLILDYKIRGGLSHSDKIKNVDNTDSLDTVLYKMYKYFGHQRVGYTKQDLIRLCGEITGNDYQEFFKVFYDSKIDLTEALSQSLSFLGLKLNVEPSSKSYEANFGFKISVNDNKLEVTKIYPSGSSYDKLVLLDHIIAVNDNILTLKNFESLFDFYAGQTVQLLVSRKGEAKKIELNPDIENGLKVVNIITI